MLPEKDINVLDITEIIYDIITEARFQEAGIKTDEGRKEPFTELNFILDCLKQRNLEPALEWAKKHRDALLAQVNFQTYISNFYVNTI